MKNKGFTLIELLAVIVILAIIALIATPMILNVVEKSRKGAAESSALGYIDAVEKQMMINLIDSDSTNDITDGVYETSNLEVSVKGEKPSEGWIQIEKGKVINYSFRIGKYFVNMDGKVYNPLVTINGKISSKPIPISFSTDSWTTIITAVRKNNTSVYKVGDTKEVDLGDFGVHTVRIANMSTPESCSTTGFSQTACGFVIEFTDVIKVPGMPVPSSNVGGWPASGMRIYANNNIYNALPNDLKTGIIDTFVVSGGGSSENTTYTSTDKIYFLSVKEVWNSSDNDRAASLTRQFDYYSTGASSIKYSNPSGYDWWWLRTAGGFNGTDIFIDVDYKGGWNRYSAFRYDTRGISPAFRIG